MKTKKHAASFSKLHTRSFARLIVPSSCLIFLGLAIPSALALAQSQSQSPNERYQVERTECYNGRSSEDGATCLKEANAALAEDKRGKLAAGGASYQKNATLRCQTLPLADKADCEKRMRGEGTVSGSVASGGFLRELMVQSPVAAK